MPPAPRAPSTSYGPRRRPGSRVTLEERVEELHEGVAAHLADALLGDLAALEDDERGHGRDPVLERDLVVLLDVQLPHPDAAGVLGGHRLEVGDHGLAGRA